MASLEGAQRKTDEVFKELGKVIVGQKGPLKEILIALMCNSHALLESYPGLAKTLAIRSMAEIMDLTFSRIQGTPDLLPADITGTYVIDESRGKKQFQFQEGPIFANVVLMDEVNRATPKTQAALLEAMQEKQVTVGNATYLLDPPFFVLATQNPIEQEGTYPLPEAQTDRFLFKIRLDYPSFEEELAIVDQYADKMKIPQLRRVLTKDSLKNMQNLTLQMPIANDIKKYAVQIVTKTRTKKDLIEYGASPRASIGLILAAKAHALLAGRKYVSKKDIAAMAYPVLRHRIILNFEAERKNLTADQVIERLL